MCGEKGKKRKCSKARDAQVYLFCMLHVTCERYIYIQRPNTALWILKEETRAAQSTLSHKHCLERNFCTKGPDTHSLVYTNLYRNPPLTQHSHAHTGVCMSRLSGSLQLASPLAGGASAKCGMAVMV